MANGESNSNNVAIVALIIVGVLIAGAALLYFSGAVGARDVVYRDSTTIIEKPQKAEAAKEESSGFSLTHEDKDGAKIEIKTPD